MARLHGQPRDLSPPPPPGVWCRQAYACTQGQQSCLLCHTPSKRRLTNNSRPAHRKQVQPAQPARDKTSPQHSNRKSKSGGWRLCRINLATKAISVATFKDGHASLFLQNQPKKQNHKTNVVYLSCHAIRDISSDPKPPKRICFRRSIAHTIVIGGFALVALLYLSDSFCQCIECLAQRFRVPPQNT